MIASCREADSAFVEIIMHSFIEVCEDHISSDAVLKLCSRIKKEPIQSVCLRDVTLSDKDYKGLILSTSISRTVRHLSLTVSVVTDGFRIQVLAKALEVNKWLSGLFLHGNPLGDEGLAKICKPLSSHTGIVILDVGDCQIGDEGLERITALLPDTASRQGLRELILSHNPDITCKGWSKLAMAMVTGNSLRTLHVDYNDLGDASASCLLTALTASRTLETLDMECVCATDTTGQLLLHLLSKNYNLTLKSINLDDNDICNSTLSAIASLITDSQSIDQHEILSDDGASLALSEPPLDDLSLTEDALNYVEDIPDDVSSPLQITVVGADDSPVFSNDDITDEQVENAIKPEEHTSMHDGDQKLHSVALVDMIQGRRRKMSKSVVTSSLDVTSNDPNPTLGLQSRSLNDIKTMTPGNLQTPKTDESNPNNPEIAFEETNFRRIEVEAAKGQTDSPNDNLDPASGQSCNFLVPQTPSVVSLHRYADGMRGQDGHEFDPISVSRQHSEHTEQTNDTTPSLKPISNKQKTDGRKQRMQKQSSESVPPLQKQFSTNKSPVHTSTHAAVNPDLLNIDPNRRRKSDAHVHLGGEGHKSDAHVHLGGEGHDTRRRLSSPSYHQGFQYQETPIGSVSSACGDVEVEEIV